MAAARQAGDAGAVGGCLPSAAAWKLTRKLPYLTNPSAPGVGAPAPGRGAPPAAHAGRCRGRRQVGSAASTAIWLCTRAQRPQAPHALHPTPASRRDPCGCVPHLQACLPQHPRPHPALPCRRTDAHARVAVRHLARRLAPLLGVAHCDLAPGKHGAVQMVDRVVSVPPVGEGHKAKALGPARVCRQSGRGGEWQRAGTDVSQEDAGKERRAATSRPPLPPAWLPPGVARRKGCARSTPCQGAKRTNAAFTVSAACMLACCLAPQTAWHGRLGQALWLLCGALGLVRHSGSCAPGNNLCGSPLKLGPKHSRRALGLVPTPRLAGSLLGARPGRSMGRLAHQGRGARQQQRPCSAAGCNALWAIRGRAAPAGQPSVPAAHARPPARRNSHCTAPPHTHRSPLQAAGQGRRGGGCPRWVTAQQLKLRGHIVLALALLRACFSLLHHLNGSQACGTHEAGRRPSPAHTSRTWPAPPQPCRWARCGVRGTEEGPSEQQGQGNSAPATGGAFARHRRAPPQHKCPALKAHTRTCRLTACRAAGCGPAR